MPHLCISLAYFSAQLLTMKACRDLLCISIVINSGNLNLHCMTCWKQHHRNHCTVKRIGISFHKHYSIPVAVVSIPCFQSMLPNNPWKLQLYYLLSPLSFFSEKEWIGDWLVFRHAFTGYYCLFHGQTKSTFQLPLLDGKPRVLTWHEIVLWCYFSTKLISLKDSYLPRCVRRKEYMRYLSFKAAILKLLPWFLVLLYGSKHRQISFRAESQSWNELPEVEQTSWNINETIWTKPK